MQIKPKHVVLFELVAENILISINYKLHALGIRTDGWQANSEKSELITSNITLGFLSLSILKSLKAETWEKISKEGKHLFSSWKKKSTNLLYIYTIYIYLYLYIYFNGLSSLLRQQIFLYQISFFFFFKILEKGNGNSNYYLS